MKTIAGLAAALLVLLSGATCSYIEWTSLHCVRCGTWALARQLRLGPEVLFHNADWAQRSIPLSRWSYDREPAILRFLREDIETGATLTRSSSPACSAGGHLFRAESVYQRSLMIERSGSLATGARMSASLASWPWPLIAARPASSSGNAR